MKYPRYWHCSFNVFKLKFVCGKLESLCCFQKSGSLLNDMRKYLSYFSVPILSVLTKHISHRARFSIPFLCPWIVTHHVYKLTNYHLLESVTIFTDHKHFAMSCFLYISYEVKDVDSNTNATNWPYTWHIHGEKGSICETDYPVLAFSKQ